MDISMYMKWLVTVTNHRLSNIDLNITDRKKSPLQHYSVLLRIYSAIHTSWVQTKYEEAGNEDLPEI